jgi:hypothetical protein
MAAVDVNKDWDGSNQCSLIRNCDSKSGNSCRENK